jgi:hypothetical protein
MALELEYVVSVETGQAEQTLRGLDTGFEKVDTAAAGLDATLKKQTVSLKDLADKERVAKATADQLADSEKRLDAQFKAAERSMVTAERSIEKLRESKRKLGEETDKTGSKYGNLTSAIARFASVAVIGTAIKRTTDYASSLNDLSQQTGIGVTALQKFSFVASQSGQSLEAVTRGIARMQDGIGGGNKAVEKGITALGLSISTIRRMKPEDQFAQIAEKIRGIEDPAKRVAAALQIFGTGGAHGGGGAALIPVLVNLKAIGDQAPVMSEKTVKALDAAGDSFDRLKTTAMGIVGTALTPLAEWFTKVPQWAQAAGIAIVGIATVGVPAIKSLVLAVGELKLALLSLASTPAGAILLGIAAGAGLAHVLTNRAIEQASASTGAHIGTPLPGTGLINIDDPRIAAAQAGKTLGGPITIGGASEHPIAAMIASVRADLAYKLTAAQQSIVKELSPYSSPAQLAEWMKVPELAVKKYIDLLQGVSNATKAASSAAKKAQAAYLKASGELARIEAARPLTSLVGIGENIGLPTAPVLINQSQIYNPATLGTGGLNNPGVVQSAMMAGAPTIWSNQSREKWERELDAALVPQIRTAAMEVGSAVQDAFQFFAGALGPAMAGVLGGALSVFQQALSVKQTKVNPLTGETIDVASPLQEWMSGPGGQKLIAGLGVAMTGLGIGTALGGSLGKVGGTLAGAGAGAGMGAVAGTYIMPGLGTAAGAVIGGIAGGIGGFFGGRAKEKEEAAQLAAIKAQALASYGSQAEMSQELGFDVSRYFNIKDVGEATRAFKELDDAIKLKEGREGLIKTFGSFENLRRVAGRAGIDISAAFNAATPEQFAREVEKLNKALAEQRERIEQLTRAGSALETLTGNLVDDLKKEKISTDDANASFQRLGNLTYAVFKRMLKDTGDFLAAISAVGGALDNLSEVAKRTGAKGSVAFQFLLDLQTVIKNNPAVIQSIQAIGTVLDVLAGTGGLTLEMFNDLGAEAAAAFDKLIKGGATSDQALLIMQPTLQKLWEHQKKFGTETDEATRKLLEMAEKSGFIGADFVPDSEKLLGVMGDLRDVMKEIRDYLLGIKRSAEEAGNAIGNIPQPPPPPGSPPTTSYPGGNTPPPTTPGGGTGGTGTTNPNTPYGPRPPSYPAHLPWPPADSGYAKGGLAKPLYAALGMYIPNGTDTVPAMLTPGEFVMTRQATSLIGKETLTAWNRGSIGIPPNPTPYPGGFPTPTPYPAPPTPPKTGGGFRVPRPAPMPVPPPFVPKDPYADTGTGDGKDVRPLAFRRDGGNVTIQLTVQAWDGQDTVRALRRPAIQKEIAAAYHAAVRRGGAAKTSQRGLN